MGNITKVIDKLRFGGMREQMIVLTPFEAKAVCDHINDLEARCETKEMKFLAICDRAYEMVLLNRDLRRQLDGLNKSEA